MSIAARPIRGSLGSTPTSCTKGACLETLERLVRNVGTADAGRRAFAVAELLEHVAFELRSGNASAAQLRAISTAAGAWCEVKMRWADGWFCALENGRDRGEQ